MTPERKVADALRVVALRLEDAIERGYRQNTIDASDLLETLVSVADRLDPSLPTTVPEKQSVVDAARALLEARENQMVTHVEWDNLEQAIAATSRP